MRVSGDQAPQRPRAAATVILVREAAGSLEVYLLRRSRRASFMPGMHAFPGGRVDPADRNAEFWDALVDLPPEALGPLGADLSSQEALTFAVAAIRETFEEAGILLVRDAPEADRERAGLEALRRTGGLSENWLAEHAIRHGWRVAVSALGRWSRWITPFGMNRRYDTVYFLARAPTGHVASPDGREADGGLWIAPDDALARNLRGEVPLSPPTAVTLQELRAYCNLAHLERELPTRTGGQALTPRLVPLEAGAVIVEPWDPEFSEERICISLDRLEHAVLPPGAPFSRIWFDGALWRPVAV